VVNTDGIYPSVIVAWVVIFLQLSVNTDGLVPSRKPSVFI